MQNPNEKPTTLEDQIPNHTPFHTTQLTPYNPCATCYIPTPIDIILNNYKNPCPYKIDPQTCPNHTGFGGTPKNIFY